MDTKKKNITVEAIENDGGDEKKAVVTKGNFDPKNYLNVRLDTEKKELSRETKIRILPIDKDSSSPFKRIKMHTIKVDKEISESGFKSYVCLEQTEDIDHEKFGRKCPFCEMRREAYKKSQSADNDADKERYKKISLEYMPNEVGIIRCIERGNEDDGPKFWKFNVRSDKKDPLNVIKGLFSTRMQESRDNIEEAKKEGLDTSNMEELNILDIYSGKDLKLTLEAVLDKTTNKPNGKVSITITDYGLVKPLSNDQEKIDKWINDEKVWSDVFTPKSYEYLSVLLDGEIPWFDRTQNKWVSKSEFQNGVARKSEAEDEEINKSINNAKASVTNISDLGDNSDKENELPF